MLSSGGYPSSSSSSSSDVCSLTPLTPFKTHGSLKFHIFVKSAEKKTKVMKIHPDDSIRYLKEKIEKHNGIPWFVQVLFHGAQLLDDHKKIQDYAGLGKDSTIEVRISSRNQNPLMCAIHANKIDAVKKLLTGNLDSPISSNGMTPLIMAVQLGRTDIAKCLIRNGAHITQADANKMTPLHWAAQKGFVDLIEIFSGTVDVLDDRGRTPLLVALENGQIDCAIQLLFHGSSFFFCHNEYACELHDRFELNSVGIELKLRRTYFNIFKKQFQYLRAPSPVVGKQERCIDTFIQTNRIILNLLGVISPSLLDTTLSSLRNLTFTSIPASSSSHQTSTVTPYLYFETREAYLRHSCRMDYEQLADDGDLDEEYVMNINRNNILADTYAGFSSHTNSELKRSLFIEFHSEMGVDSGGLTREWAELLSRSLFNPDYALFVQMGKDGAFQPNPCSYVNPEHLSYFHFVGRFVGYAIYKNLQLPVRFTKAFYENLINTDHKGAICLADLKETHPDVHRNLSTLLNTDGCESLYLTFSIDTDVFGSTKTVDLVIGGKDIPVTDSNKSEYADHFAKFLLSTSIEPQIREFQTGLYSVITRDLFSLFNAEELEMLIVGLDDCIDIKDWHNNTAYEGYEKTSDQIVWFWKAVETFKKDVRAKLLAFCTGSSKLPLGGFGSYKEKFTILRGTCSKGEDRLPQAHTCFNQMVLPCYSSYDQLLRCLAKTLDLSPFGFGFA